MSFKPPTKARSTGDPEIFLIDIVDAWSDVSGNPFITVQENHGVWKFDHHDGSGGTTALGQRYFTSLADCLAAIRLVKRFHAIHDTTICIID